MTLAKISALAALAVIMVISPSSGRQFSKQECAEFIKIAHPLTVSLALAAEKTQDLNWNLIIENSSGVIQQGARKADLKKAAAVAALSDYRNAIVEVMQRAGECPP